MIGLIVVSHGNFGLELLKTAELILGPQKNAVALAFTSQDRKEDLIKRIQEKIESIAGDKGVLILVDMFGASPHQASLLAETKKTVKILTGVNLPMIIEFCLKREQLTLDPLVQTVIHAGQTGIREGV